MYRIQIFFWDAGYSSQVVITEFFIEAESEIEAREKVKIKFTLNHCKKLLNKFDESVQNIIIGQLHNIGYDSIDNLLLTRWLPYTKDTLRNAILQLLEGHDVENTDISIIKIIDGLVCSGEYGHEE